MTHTYNKGVVPAPTREDLDKQKRDQLILGASRFMDTGGAFAEKFKRNGPLTQAMIDAAEDFSKCSPPPFKGALPAEGNGDTFIPAGKPLPVGDSRLEHAEEFKFFDGSIPPGISTDPTKPVVEAIPDTPLQRVRKATMKLLADGLELNAALEALDNYQTLTGRP